MRSTLVRTTLFVATAYALPSSQHGFASWSPPGPNDVRAPCPMLNSLANHGFLPHHGQNLSEQVTVNALYDALNINKTLGKALFDFAMTTSPFNNGTTFDLDNLSRHNILEHDASLSRADAYTGDNHNFNQNIFNETRSYWKGSTIDAQMSAQARLARLTTSVRTNPSFTLSELGNAFNFGEIAAYLIIFGDKNKGTAPKALVEYFFENERLPTELGWKRSDVLLQEADLDRVTDMIVNATIALGRPSAKLRRTRNIHNVLS